MKKGYGKHLLILVLGIIVAVLANEGLKLLISSEKTRLVLDLLIFYFFNGAVYHMK